MRFAILLPAFLLACTADDGDDPADAASEDARVLVDRGTPAAWWTPSVDTTWTWQLKDTIDTRIDAMVYDIDLIDAPDAVLDALHAANRRVVCYFSAGSSENWRDDFDALPAAALGKLLPD
ncbi:MAG: endo alpha-1,4 polygalactosaminidase, partial [Myxococcales bacterium]|nr:endo alpha-1,4 polygalactosaminidase [Myxococcales bacterium]